MQHARPDQRFEVGTLRQRGLEAAVGWMTACLVAAVLLWPVQAVAAEQVLVLDPQTSRLSFELGGTVHDVHGSLVLAHAELHIEPQTGRAWGDVVLEARATATGNRSRDRKMHRDVLASDRYPEIVLHLEQVNGELDLAGTSDLVLVGTIELHGEEHAFSFPSRVTCDKGRLTGSARFVIPYVAWGLEDPSFLVFRVAKEVEVELEVEGELRDAEAAQGSEAADAASEPADR